MVTSQPLPPTGRDFEIYRRVRVDLWSTREAAAEAEVSQSRVCQIVRKVAKFLEEATPSEHDEKEDRRRRAHVAEQLAAERVEAMYGRAVRSFDMSIRIVPPSQGKSNFGEQKYLFAAGRLGHLTGKLPVSAIGYGSMEEEEEVSEIVEQGMQDEAETAPVAEAIVPPVGDYSLAPEMEAVAERSTAMTGIASAVTVDVCEPSAAAANGVKIDSQRSTQIMIAAPAPQSRDGSPPLNGKQLRTRREFLQAPT